MTGYEKYKEAMQNLSLSDILHACDYIQALAYHLPKNSRLKNRYKEIIEPLEKFLSACITNKQCPHCGMNLYLSDIEGYEYVCVCCHENFYDMEVK